MRAAALWQAMTAKQKRKRSSSAPPAGARGVADAEPPGRAAEPGGAAADLDEFTLEGALAPMPDGDGYASENDDDRPARVVEDVELVGLGDQEPVHEPEATAEARGSPARRTVTAATGAKEAAKKLSAAQQKYQEDQSKWKTLKTDGTAPPLARPDFLPFKEGTAPEGFVAIPEHKTGGLSLELSKVLKPDTPPYQYMAEVGGFDARLFLKIQSGSNGYAASKGAGAKDHYSEFVPFSKYEIVKGCGLLLRNGVAPTPNQVLAFQDPRNSFVWGDNRTREVWEGKGCGGPARRWQHFRSFFHIQSYAQQDMTKTDPKTGQFVKLDANTAGPLVKLEPMLSYMRMKWQRGWRPGKDLALDEETVGFKGRCSLVVRIKNKNEGDGLQADCICDEGYTFTFWFRCDHLPCTRDKDVSDRDTRCAWLVDQLPGAWYHLFMDNLFTSWKFGEMLAKRQCLFAGTCTVQEWRGLHREVVQKEVRRRRAGNGAGGGVHGHACYGVAACGAQVTTIKALEEAKGTLKASVRTMPGADKCEVIYCWTRTFLRPPFRGNSLGRWTPSERERRPRIFA